MPDLYDAVGHGMWAYSHAALLVTTLSAGRFAPEPGTLVVATHRRETDVPILCPPLYFGMGGRRNRTDRLHFAARDDMFPPGLLRRLPGLGPRAAGSPAAYPIGVGRWAPARQRLSDPAARAWRASARSSPRGRTIRSTSLCPRRRPGSPPRACRPCRAAGAGTRR